MYLSTNRRNIQPENTLTCFALCSRFSYLLSGSKNYC